MSTIAPISVPMSTIAESASDALHSVGNRLTLPTELADGFDSLTDALAPSKTVAVGVGTRAAVASGRTVRRHPVLVVGGVAALVATLVWFAKRRRADDTSTAYTRDGADARKAA